MNIFLFFKDAQFFKEVIRPFISNKIQKTFVDHFLLQNTRELLKFARPESFSALNPMEAGLLTLHLSQNGHQEQALQIFERYKAENKLNIIDSKTFHKHFDTVLTSKQQGEPGKERRRKPYKRRKSL
jgi:hypothetical protein